MLHCCCCWAFPSSTSHGKKLVEKEEKFRCSAPAARFSVCILIYVEGSRGGLSLVILPFISPLSLSKCLLCCDGWAALLIGLFQS